MSIVGTRPPLISETNLYEPRHKVRLAIKPGITGMWQVSGRSDITDFEEVVRLDKEYIENWDIGLDIKILLKTVMVVAKSKVTLINIISSLTLQVVTVISGFIIPKIILTNFGSSVNGLVSSLNQFLSYITLIEGGITGVVLANLYKPLI